jgi:hypothetical protein
MPDMTEKEYDALDELRTKIRQRYQAAGKTAFL